MDDLIYGLELQARALVPQYGEGNEVRFFIGTNSLKPTNQIHLIECNEEKSTIKSKIFEHSLGEIWKLNSSPHNSQLLASCYNVQKGAMVQMHAALLTLPEDLDNINVKTEFLPWAQVEVLATENYGEKVKTIEFHPYRPETLACVIDGKVVVFNRTESETRVIAEAVAGSTSTKNSSNFNTGKWSHHQQGNQFVVLHDGSVRSFDVRDAQRCVWTIEDAHAQYVRDIDCNPNKQCHFVTGGDDGYVKIWDSRMPKEPVFARNDHAHWVWAVRFNTFHDQLVLSSSSDCKVLLTCASTVSSESLKGPDGTQDNSEKASVGTERRSLPDGLLQTFDQYEDSVYCVEWSNVDPWIFASLSYDGRAIISRVPKHFKYQIII